MHEDHEESETLLPCPFCGAEPTYGEVSEGENFGGQYIECSDPRCGCSTCLMFPTMESVKDQLREKWNRRGHGPAARETRAEESSSLQRVVGRLETALRYMIDRALYVCAHDYGPNAPVGTRVVAVNDLRAEAERAAEALRQTPNGRRSAVAPTSGTSKGDQL